MVGAGREAGGGPSRVALVLAILAAGAIVAIPHLLTVDRGESVYETGTGKVHRCPPVPDSRAFRIAVRDVTCEDGTALVDDVLSAKPCSPGFCQSGDFRCNRTVREGGRRFWLCRLPGGGGKVRFVLAGKS